MATYVTFGLAVACGAYLVAVAGPELLAVGAASILAGVLYTGGPRPYGYEGLGEVFVFLFFGIVAVAGSYFVQVQQLPWQAFACAVPVGLLASAILVVNNVRDLETDRRAGKRTLAVRLGRARTRALYTAMVAGAFADRAAAVGVRVDGRVAAAALGRDPAGGAGRADRRTRTDGPSLNGALAKTGIAAARLLPAVRAGILASGGIGGGAELEIERRQRSRSPSAAAERLRHGRASASCWRSRSTDDDGADAATARRRRWRPTTA